MADFVAERGDDTVLIALRVPRHLWRQYENRHNHYGKAISQLKLVVCDLLVAHSLTAREWQDVGDPFYRETA